VQQSRNQKETEQKAQFNRKERIERKIGFVTFAFFAVKDPTDPYSP